jgi:hypothetical protein
MKPQPLPPVVFAAAYMKLKAGWSGVYFDPELQNSEYNGKSTNRF